MRIVIDSNVQELTRSLNYASRGVLMEFIDRYLGRGAQEVAREARRRAPKAFSTLTHAIKTRRIGQADYKVTAGTMYSRPLEEGSRPGGLPRPVSLYYWIRTKRIKPRDPKMDERDLAFAISRSIYKKGTPAQPFMLPALEAKSDRLRILMQQGIAAGLRKLER